MDCCYLSDSGDTPSFCFTTFPKAKKLHKCCECGRDIAAGASYQRTSGRWEHSFEVFKTCMDCYHIRSAFDCGGWTYGQLYSDLRDSAENLNTGCLANIETASAKSYFMDFLRKIRGIE